MSVLNKNIMIQIYREIRNWFKYNFNINKWRLVKESILGNPYDFGYFYSLQLSKLEEMKSYFEKSKYLCEDKKDEVIKWLDLAIKTLKIGYFDGDGGLEFTELIPNSNSSDIISKWQIKCTKYVNIKNKHRFESCKSLFPTDYYLYEEKARCLYHKIIKEKSYLWWD